MLLRLDEKSSLQLPDEPATGDAVSLPFLREHFAFPYLQTESEVHLAIADESPNQEYLIQAVKLATGKTVIASTFERASIDEALARWARRKNEWQTDNEKPVPSQISGSEDIQHLRDIALETPVIQIVNDLMEQAAHTRATDIHIEPFERSISVRLRVDGMLRPVSMPPVEYAKAIVSRIKILAGLDIAERRLPQDGRTKININHRQFDLRVATMPTIHGEAVAIRLLDNARRALNLSKLGFNERNQSVLERALDSAYGLILVTGPTGSGKTTTLATALATLNDGQRKILTIEDPIEYELAGVNQTQTKPEIGLTFANALRAFLRHDPDVIMVGEMRDSETAGIGIHAALTGHIVLTTLHTNSAAGAIVRLLDMGIDAYLLASSLRCIVAQRLVRVLCENCKEVDDQPLSADEQEHTRCGQSHSEQHFWRARGCNRCSDTGYVDRIAICEVLDVNDDLRAHIKPDVTADGIEALAQTAGMTTMWQDGLLKCQLGLTSRQEVRRVAFAG